MSFSEFSFPFARWGVSLSAVRLLLLLVLAAGCLSNAAAAPLRVVTWNTRWLPGGHPDATAEEKAGQMAKAQKIVKALNPDLLLLQEVADWKAAEEVCSVVPGLKVQTVSAFTTRPQQVVIASKLPVDSSWSAKWDTVLGEDNPPRGYAFAAIKLPGGKTLLAYSVHFKSNRGDPGDLPANIATRQESARQLLAHIGEMKKLYADRGPLAVLVGGDFNTSLDDPTFKAETTLRTIRDAGLTWSYANMAPSARITIPADGKYPNNTFDHFFFSGLKLVKASVANGKASSDHNPVLALLQP